MKLSPDKKAGLLITAIVHLAVIIIFLLIRIGYEIQRENSFVLDFTQQEEQERIREEEVFRKLTAEQLEEMIAAAAAIPIRNVAVDRAALKDDRGPDAEELYREAERLARELSGADELPEPEDNEVVAAPSTDLNSPKEPEKPYSGPSVLSWSLDGRKASHLPIPAYRCYGAGEVTVMIVVDNRGTVIAAKIDDRLSSADECLRTFAVRAARLSRFSASQDAPARQRGSITYAFIAQ